MREEYEPETIGIGSLSLLLVTLVWSHRLGDKVLTICLYGRINAQDRWGSMIAFLTVFRGPLHSVLLPSLVAAFGLAATHETDLQVNDSL